MCSAMDREQLRHLHCALLFLCLLPFLLWYLPHHRIDPHSTPTINIHILTQDIEKHYGNNNISTKPSTDALPVRVIHIHRYNKDVHVQSSTDHPPAHVASTHVEPKVTESVRQFSGRGYVIALSLWEQITMATRNLIQLQCWSSMHGLMVVEPYVDDSYLKFTFNQSKGSHWTNLDRLFDVEEWSGHLSKKHIAPLISRKQFMTEMSTFSKNVILVQMHYNKRDGPRRHPCSFNWSKELKSMNQSFGHHLNVVRKVCMDGKQASFKTFNQKVFGGISAHDCLVIFSEWRGVGPDRVTAAPSCPDASTYACRKPLSRSIKTDAEAYAQKYLGGIGRYNAIMTRFERTGPKFWTLGKLANRKRMLANMRNLLNTWMRLKREISLPNAFLAFDYGKFGSDSFRHFNYFDAKDHLLHFHKTIYEGRMSYEEWESSFEGIAHTNQSLYIALLQLEIVTSAKCVILAGTTSNFLMFAYNLYMEKHKDSKSRCLKFINKPSGKPQAYACNNWKKSKH